MVSNSSEPGKAELPGYQEGRGTNGALDTIHSYSLKNSKGMDWLFLRVKSRAPSSATLPSFTTGDPIQGEVEVDVDKAESSKGVVIALVGECTATGQEPVPFLNVKLTLWSPSTSSAKLSGKTTWPFSLELPNECGVDASPKGSQERFPLPPTFTERASPAYIDYKIIATVKRGMLRVNQTLSTSFGYVPRWSAPRPSPLRLEAYREGGELIGPEVDPDGWQELAPFQIGGKLFGSRTTNVEVSLFISKPTTYAVGSPIHLHLVLRSQDTQMLDLLSLPAAPRIDFTRTVAIGTAAADDSAPRRSNNTFSEHINRACWWPIIEGAPEENVRSLRGEIDIPRNAKPGFLFPRFSVRYYISVFPFSAPGFTPSSGKEKMLASGKVTVVTENAPGVIPRSHAPPGYAKPQEGNWNTSMGYLENGNQRFYHHHMR